VVICYQDQVEIYNPLGRYLRSIKLEEKLLDCFFNLDSYLSFYLVYENYQTKNMIQTTIKLLQKENKQVNNFQQIKNYQLNFIENRVDIF